MEKKKRRRLRVNPVFLAASSTGLVLILYLVGIPILNLIELKAYDLRFLSRGRLDPSPAVVMAVIDEKSLDEEGRWPWPRSKMGRLIEALSGDGARVVGFDIGFLEPDENSHLVFIEELEDRIRDLGIRNTSLETFLAQSRAAADNDRALARAIRDAKARVVLGYFFHMGGETADYRINPKEIERQIERISSSKYPVVVYERQGLEASPFIRAYAPEGNLDILTEATPYSGYFNMRPDPDGGVRWMPLIIQCGEDIFPPLSILCTWLYLSQPQMLVRVSDYGVSGIQLGDRVIPTDENGHMLINYLGPPKTFPHYSISDILAGKLPPGTFRDKIVLVGATALGIYDLRNTPFSPIYPGLEVHATVIDNILNERYLKRPKWTSLYDIMALAFLGLVTGLVIPRLSAVKGAFFALGLFLLHIFVTRWLFIRAGIWINMVYPLLALTLTYVILAVYHYITEERERKKIRGAFSYYVSSSVVNEVLKDPERLKLGGDKKELTVLFSDIRGFTTISEGMTPEELVQLLNEYLTVMTDVVFKYDGTLDKYIGDAIMAIYGAPFEQPNHAASACHSALEMMARLKELNEKWIDEGKTPLDIGIGINTGMMMVGNMGSEQRFDYTVMGDAVNLGSRLEGANKNYRTHILISESTYERVRDEFVCMEVDSVRVKGRTRPVKIYQLHAHGRVPDVRAQAIVFFERGLKHYKSRRWDDAIKFFRMVSDLDGEIHAAAHYIQRCEELKQHPPAQDWDGTYTMKTK
ncbi:MAG: adenylate/guanylate cyclase domain-containing protein [Deltaproteobacteria bacterium]|nr:adenylate/guanylate cyclase domain-containing protein [Deltaproteobacteria bacterium]MBW1925357.1 adenylate/guanylate cyclase domain-containing protein [Deltaproteobacteria bacterium]MBW1948617.1 adenylate/guanylate cyclase domain-containing protein [Deltaproteobacteria bacterium]MBW2009506.1 adenylate/guanylate cyclase domain-containing protein [Deltaproteobacteria bacterium]MBW2101061.1 adenylate/guanylate cyclase domain-containing protein [Deltaproteobacteria bacterium]